MFVCLFVFKLQNDNRHSEWLTRQWRPPVDSRLPKAYDKEQGREVHQSTLTPSRCIRCRPYQWGNSNEQQMRLSLTHASSFQGTKQSFLQRLCDCNLSLSFYCPCSMRLLQSMSTHTNFQCIDMFQFGWCACVSALLSICFSTCSPLSHTHAHMRSLTL